MKNLLHRSTAILFMTLVLTLGMIPAAHAGGAKAAQRCASRYPVVLVHGMGWKDLGPLEYFNKIPAALRKEGCTVYSANQISFGGHTRSAESLAPIIGRILAETGAEKVNLIGQSQGGLTIRALMAFEQIPVTDRSGNTTLRPARDVVASVTTISSPHTGTALADVVLGLLPDQGTINQELVTDILSRATGFLWQEENTDAEEALIQLSDAYMQNVFNEDCPVVEEAWHEDVYYQSYAGEVTGPTMNVLLFGPTGTLLKLAEGGPNDGFVSVESARLGNFRGIIRGCDWLGGVDHAYEINHFLGITPGFNALGFYCDVVADLKDRGF